MSSDWINSPAPILPEIYRCNNNDCDDPKVKYLYHLKNQSIYKCCSGCYTTPVAVKKSDFKDEVYGGMYFEEFQEERRKWARSQFEVRSRLLEARAARVLGESEDFFRSRDWFDLRYKTLLKHGRKCQCCGRIPPEVILQVDHIKPRSKYPELALDQNNLQVLCLECNYGKSNRDETDFRETHEHR